MNRDLALSLLELSCDQNSGLSFTEPDILIVCEERKPHNRKSTTEELAKTARISEDVEKKEKALHDCRFLQAVLAYYLERDRRKSYDVRR